MNILVASVLIGERTRKNLGDIDGLALSIKQAGLLHPIVVTDKHELVAGGRRLAAVRSLGHETIEATVLPMSPEEMLRAEQDENTVRLDLRRSEMVDLGLRLEAVLKKRVAEQRTASGRRLGTTGGHHLAVPATCSVVGDVRGAVGKALGIAGSTYGLAKQIVEAAAADPEKYSDIVEEMDKTGNVVGAHRELKERQFDPDNPPPAKTSRAEKVELVRDLAAKGYTAGQVAKELGIKRPYALELASKNDIKLAHQRIGKRPRVDPNTIVEETVRSLEGAVMVIDIVESRFDELEQEHMQFWATSMAKSLKRLGELSRKLKGSIQ